MMLRNLFVDFESCNTQLQNYNAHDLDRILEAMQYHPIYHIL